MSKGHATLFCTTARRRVPRLRLHNARKGFLNPWVGIAQADTGMVEGVCPHKKLETRGCQDATLPYFRGALRLRIVEDLDNC
jgi:hypothetical protein